MRRLTTLLLAVLSVASLTAAETNFTRLLAGPAPVERVYRTVGGRDLRLFIFAPAEPATKPRAAVVWFHGGAWRGGSPDVFFPHARYFAERGLVSISVEYRLITPEALGVADCVEDARAAFRFVREHAVSLGIDPARIAAGGDSAGGHLAACLATVPGRDAASRPDALLLYNPVLDLIDGDWVRFVVGGPTLNNKAPNRPAPTAAELARATAVSPVMHVPANLPPTLLVQGEDDRITPPVHAKRFAEAARAAGARCDLQLLPAVAHAFVVPRYKWPEPVVVDAVRRADRFLASLGWLTGEPTLVVSTTPAWTPLPR